MMRLLLVDNYDSFTYNLLHLFGALGADVDVLRNDDPALDEGAVLRSAAVVVGPGPGRPAGAGRSTAIIRAAADAAKPLLGVCLGAQAIGEIFGGYVDHAPALVHGKTSCIVHDGSGVFAHLPSPFEATRYHSLCVRRDDFPKILRITATADDGTVQGLVHRELPLHGVQFHPESILTTQGHALAANFLQLARP